ncbi:HlyD family type I secretion periplasmic adaptor subunit [Mesorhizobium sp. B2-4-14]|uniref:HlyD family type I secretion periplasmic adaptor subunit n=1 Tax=Mesorhizobium sp. B2-4-14 TaxID=2589935 RepID=UPI001128F126|nr:HlyD family type I secretion periplasmic adaptor subunit [Mesorhizobium sp. B2-4-14]TPK95515.1 HlyD family type I secretion periplasmic adaptor subunit [Mesorhizobium sp. B2-4-14]
MNPANKIVPFPAASPQRSRQELAFLPAALEIVETPPSPIGRAIAAVIGIVFCLAIAWATFGKADIVASAPGKIIPSGRTKVIQPLEAGVIRAIHVQDGQTVKAGDILIELDPTMHAAERDHLRSDLMAAQLDIARLVAALGTGSDPLDEFEVPAGAPPELVQMEREFLMKQVEEHRAKLASVDRQEAQKQAERDTIDAQVEKINATIPLIEQRLEVRKSLMEKGLDSKLDYLDTLQQLVEQQQDVIVGKSHHREAEASLAAILETRRQADAEYVRTLFGELTEARRKAAGLASDLIKAEQLTKFQVLTAPIDGYVQQLSVHTVGGVVTPAQSLLMLVPTDSHLEIEAMISNRDIGFIRPGQTVAIKIDTFDFTRYGLLHGTVLSVSHDTILRDAGQENSNLATLERSDSGQRNTQAPVYAARISLDQTSMRIDENSINLSPGMEVTAEIKTGSRMLIDYLLSPLMRYGHDSLRER